MTSSLPETGAETGAGTGPDPDTDFPDLSFEEEGTALPDVDMDSAFDADDEEMVTVPDIRMLGAAAAAPRAPLAAVPAPEEEALPDAPGHDAPGEDADAGLDDLPGDLPDMACAEDIAPLADDEPDAFEGGSVEASDEAAPEVMEDGFDAAPDDDPEQLPFDAACDAGQTGDDLPSGMDVEALIASTETELSRRFDDIELVMMELLNLFSAPSNADHQNVLHVQLHASLTRVEETLGAARLQRDALSARLDGLEDLLRQANERAARRGRRRRARAGEEQVTLQGLLDRLAALTPPDLGPLLDGQAALQARLEALPAVDIDPVTAQLADLQARLATLAEREPPSPDLAPLRDAIAALSDRDGPPPDLDLDPLRVELGRGIDRIAALLGERDSRAQAERKGLISLRQGLEATVSRLDGSLTALDDRLAPPEDTPSLPDLLAPLQEAIAALSAREAPTPDLDPLRVELGRGIDRIAALLGERDSRAEAERKGLISLRQGLEATVSRLDGSLTALDDRLAPPEEEAGERKGLSALRHGLEATLTRLETLIGQLDNPPGATDTPDGITPLLEELAARPAPDLAPLQTRLDAGIDRIAAATAAQGRGLEAERRALMQALNGLGSISARLEAATRQIETQAAAQAPTDPDALDARLTRIEEQLDRLQAPPPGDTAEALRDLSMILAEMMARQERLFTNSVDNRQASA